MPQSQIVCFDGWELRLDTGELSREGSRLRLQDQPLRVLTELLAHPGELVTREQLIARLWPKGVVDFDTGLNSAVRKLRLALQDEAETPRYIETVPRKGYRFIGKIEPTQVATAFIPPGMQIVPASPPPSSPGPADAPARPEGNEGAVPFGPSAVPPITSEAPSATAGITAGVVRNRNPLLYIAAAVAVILVIGAALTTLRGTSVPSAFPEQLPVGSRTMAVLPLRTSGTDEAAALIAQSVTDILRNRLAGLEGLTVIAVSPAAAEPGPAADGKPISHKLNARFLLQGSAERVRDRLRVDLQLLDTRSDKPLWSATFDRSLSEIAPLREAVVQRVAATLGMRAASETGSAPAAISLDAYQLYIRGQRLLATSNPADAEQAVELFRRATMLDQSFARAYLALGQALLLQGDPTAIPSPELQSQVTQQLDRALELNPALGEAWIERARLTSDTAEAERLFRKGLELSPNHGAGYSHYANFLWAQSRPGEAIDTINRAVQIDPLTPSLYLRKAFFVMVTTSDVAEHDRLVREALAINPTLPSALNQLANSRWEYSGEFADAAQLIERSLAIDPNALYPRQLARDIYLDLREPEAAAAALGDAPPLARVQLAQYRSDHRLAAALLSGIPSDDWEDGGPGAPDSEALRDNAIATGNVRPTLKLLESAYAVRRNGLPMWRRGLALVYAHTLTLAGEVERGRQLAQSILVLLDTHSVGRTPDWFSRERAAAFAVLGDDERTLEQLTISVRTGKVYRWWYLAEHDPLYAHLRSDPRFKALDDEVRRRLDRQREALGRMKRVTNVSR